MLSDDLHNGTANSGCFTGDTDFEDAVAILKRDSRRYAKRQLTWFRRREDALWINLSEPGNPVDKALEYINTKFRR